MTFRIKSAASSVFGSVYEPLTRYPFIKDMEYEIKPIPINDDIPELIYENNYLFVNNISSLEDLLDFMKKTGWSIVVSGPDNMFDGYTIIIYDDYLE